MLESTSKEQIKNLIDILFSWPLSQINNWQNDERIIHILAEMSEFNTDEIKRFMPLFLNKLQSFLSDNSISVDFNSDIKLSDSPGWEGLNVLLVDAVFDLFNQQNQIFESIDFSSLNLNSILGSMGIGWNEYLTPAESGGILNEAWSMISEEDRQALNAVGFNINNQIPVQSQQVTISMTNSQTANQQQTNSTNAQAPAIHQNLSDERRFIENIAELFTDFYSRNDSNNFPFTLEEINNITNYFYDIYDDQTAIRTIYNLPSARNFIAEQTIDNFNVLAKSLNDMRLNRNGPAPSLAPNYQLFK